MRVEPVHPPDPSRDKLDWSYRVYPNTYTRTAAQLQYTEPTSYAYYDKDGRVYYVVSSPNLLGDLHA